MKLDLIQVEGARIMAKADIYLKRVPRTVTDDRCSRRIRLRVGARSHVAPASEPEFLRTGRLRAGSDSASERGATA